jgi:ankyrin repeat protein
MITLCTLAVQAQTGPWARYDSKMKGEALISKADGGYLDEIKSIVEGGGDVNWQTHMGLTPLIAAVLAGKTEVVQYLLAQGADVSLRDQNGKSAAI